MWIRNKKQGLYCFYLGEEKKIPCSCDKNSETEK